MTWNDYLELIEKANSYRNRVKPKRLKRDMDKYLKRGSPKAQAGSPFKKAKYSFKGKGFNDISAPLEEAEEESFTLHDTLQPDIWEEEKLVEEVRQRLIEIVEDFIENLDISVVVEDLRLTGSLANYNWSKYSDIDVHILVDFSKIDENVELVKAFFDQARMRWNANHRILIHGFEVEIYVEDVAEEHRSSGIYSLCAPPTTGNEVGTEWLIKPEPGEGIIDFATADKKAQDYKDRTQCIDDLISQEKDYQTALDYIERTKEKLRDMRKAGLDSPQAEFSAENIAFKILRRDETLQRLNDLKQIAYDEMMTIREE